MQVNVLQHSIGTNEVGRDMHLKRLTQLTSSSFLLGCNAAAPEQAAVTSKAIQQIEELCVGQSYENRWGFVLTIEAVEIVPDGANSFVTTYNLSDGSSSLTKAEFDLHEVVFSTAVLFPREIEHGLHVESTGESRSVSLTTTYDDGEATFGIHPSETFPCDQPEKAAEAFKLLQAFRQNLP